MMLYPAMKDLLAQVPSRYQLVNVVARRARQISDQADTNGCPFSDQADTKGCPLEEKAGSIAVCEVAEGKLTWKEQE